MKNKYTKLSKIVHIFKYCCLYSSSFGWDKTKGGTFWHSLQSYPEQLRRTDSDAGMYFT